MDGIGEKVLKIRFFSEEEKVNHCVVVSVQSGDGRKASEHANEELVGISTGEELAIKLLKVIEGILEETNLGDDSIEGLL